MIFTLASSEIDTTAMTITIKRLEHGLVLMADSGTGDTLFSRFVADRKVADDVEVCRSEYEGDEGFWRGRECAERRAVMRRFLGQRLVEGQLAWWPAAAGSGSIRGGQVTVVHRLRYFAGVRDWTRGRHWDRRSRYGIH